LIFPIKRNIFQKKENLFMDNILEISRIVDGAVKGDIPKVLGYLNQLCRKLQESGETAAAERLLKTAHQTKTSEISPAIAKGAAQLPVDSESRLALADEEQILKGQVKVILEPSVKQRIEEFINYVKAADKLLARNVGISPSMLIYGQPGVGKTELARYIASELQLPLITARSDSLISSFLGSTAKNLRSLFEHVKSRPCILFLDELDSVAKLRDDHHELGELKRVVISLLQNIDSVAGETILIAATNHPHLLDKAVWRRFTYKIEIRKPNIDERKELFRLFLNDYAPPEEELNEFALISDNVTGADIQQLCMNTLRAAAFQNNNTVQTIDVFREIIQYRLGNNIDFMNITNNNLHRVRDINSRIFTLNRLALLFNSSEATLSRRLNEKGIRNGKQSKTSNKGGNPPRTRP
jgi:SpoVK/Ycf46/Vps4 family AAA+-type ATPase